MSSLSQLAGMSSSYDCSGIGSGNLIDEETTTTTHEEEDEYDDEEEDEEEDEDLVEEEEEESGAVEVVLDEEEEEADEEEGEEIEYHGDEEYEQEDEGHDIEDIEEINELVTTIDHDEPAVSTTRVNNNDKMMATTSLPIIATQKHQLDQEPKIFTEIVIEEVQNNDECCPNTTQSPVIAINDTCLGLLEHENMSPVFLDDDHDHNKIETSDGILKVNKAEIPTFTFEMPPTVELPDNKNSKQTWVINLTCFSVKIRDHELEMFTFDTKHYIYR